MARLNALLLCAVLVLCGRNQAFGQRIEETDPRAMIQANFLYQFAANCNWPADTRKGKFMIGVLGHPAIFDHFSEKYGTKPIGTQSIEAVELIDVNSAVYYHILFIDKSRKQDFQKALKELKGRPTLIVTNWEGGLQMGAHINFKNQDGQIRYEMNTTAMEERKIAAGVKILQWKVD